MKPGRPARAIVIDIGTPTAAWRRALPRAATLVRKAAIAALAGGFPGAPVRRARKIPARAAFEVSVLLTGNAQVQRLNRAYRGKDKPTNVLSFPADAPPTAAWMLGDVVIAYGVTKAEAQAEGKLLAAHLSHLVLHGVLHLLGYDHERDQDAVIMERLERKIMARMGYADPYAVAAPSRTTRRQ